MEKINRTPYTRDQVELIAAEQIPKNGLATLLAYETGIKAGEIASLRPAGTRQIETMGPWQRELFTGRGDFVEYSIEHSRGISRRIAVSEPLANRLEKARLMAPISVYEGGWRYLCGYDIGFGRAWVQSFAVASDIVLSYSHGTLGLRYSYIAERYLELELAGYLPRARSEIIAMETGLSRASVNRYLSVGKKGGVRKAA